MPRFWKIASSKHLPGPAPIHQFTDLKTKQTIKPHLQSEQASLPLMYYLEYTLKKFTL